MIKRFFKDMKDFVVEEYKFIIISILTLILFFCPVNYYIVIGGGISDIGERIVIEDGDVSKGSFNMSYVSELIGTVGTYLLSYVIPSWDRESADLYKYDTTESIEDIEFRSSLALESANGNAIYWAYKLANKKCDIVDSKIYIISVMSEYNTPFKVGDMLLSINDQSFPTLVDYQKYIQTLDAGSLISVKVKRGGKEKVLESKLYSYDDRNIMGVYLQVVNEYDVEPEVTLKFQRDESGPSAGLITTLAIYDKLTEGDLTNSLKIAGTGTIEADGSVGEIGGVKYKLVGAERGGADIFLAPTGSNYKECVKIKKEKNLKIKVIEVKSIEDAINKLNKLK